VLVAGLVTVISLDDLVEEGSKGVVGIVGTCVNTDSGVGPLGATENALSEGEAELVSAILALFPDVSGEALHKKRVSSGGEVREASNVIVAFEMAAHHAAVDVSVGDVASVRSTHWFFGVKRFYLIMN
jgi:hypothetical protein